MAAEILTPNRRLITPEHAIWVAGSVGTDAFGTPSRQPSGTRPGRKYPITTHDEYIGFLTKYGLLNIPDRDKYPGNSTGNLAVGLRKATERDVVVFTVLSETDASTGRIRRDMDEQGVRLYVTPNVGPEGEKRHNSVALILPPDKNPTIVSYKPDAPPIAFNPESGERQPGLLVMGAANGQWEETIENGKQFAKQYGLPIAVFATESQVAQLEKNPIKRDAYISQLREQTSPNGALFIANARETEMVLKAGERNPNDSDPYTLAMELKELSGGNVTRVSMTRGRRGSVYLDEDNNFHTLSVPKLPIAGFDDLVNGLGAGDAYAAALLAGLQEWGDDVKRIMQKAAEGAVQVMTRRDAQSGQMTRQQFLAPPHEVFRYSVKEPRSQLFPNPPKETNQPVSKSL